MPFIAYIYIILVNSLATDILSAEVLRETRYPLKLAIFFLMPKMFQIFGGNNSFPSDQVHG